MASITRRTWKVRGKLKQGFQARARRKGSPEFSKLFKARSDAVKWSKEPEAKLLLARELLDAIRGVSALRYETACTEEHL